MNDIVEGESYLKNFELKMKITPEIGPEKVITFSEEFPGCENGETAKLSNGALPNFGSTKTSTEEQGRQHPNPKV